MDAVLCTKVSAVYLRYNGQERQRAEISGPFRNRVHPPRYGTLFPFHFEYASAYGSLFGESRSYVSRAKGETVSLSFVYLPM